MIPLTSRLQVAAGAALYGGITAGGRYFALRGFSLLEISLTGVVFATLVLAPVLALRPALRPRWRDLDLFVGFGLVGAALQLSQFGGIVLGVPVALVALLLYTQPIWTVVLGRWLLAEAITPRKLAATGLALAGTAILLDPTGLAGAELPAAGVLAAILAGVMLSLWVILARMSALRCNPAAVTTFGYSLATTLALLVATPAVQHLMPDPSLSRLDAGVWLVHWPAVALYTLVANILPALLVIAGMRRVDASSAGVLLLLEPVSAALLAAWAFGEPLTGNLIAGGALILGSNVLLVRGGERAVGG